MRCATVKVCDGDKGYIVINESDFDSKQHKKFSEAKKPVKKAAPKKAAYQKAAKSK